MLMYHSISTHAPLQGVTIIIVSIKPMLMYHFQTQTSHPLPSFQLFLASAL